jgi:hypothetical protein
MTFDSVLTPGRIMAESLHVDTFTVYRATGNKVTDPVTLEERDEYAEVLDGVKGKFKSGEGQDGEAQIPGQTVAETSLSWHTSVSTLGVRTSDEVECTAVGPSSDPELVGVRVRVTGPFLRSLATARRFRVEELS